MKKSLSTIVISLALVGCMGGKMGAKYFADSGFEWPEHLDRYG